MLQVVRADKGEVSVLRLRGTVDDAFAHELIRRAVRACLEDGRYCLVLNCESVSFISNIGIAAFLEDLGRIRSLKGDIKLSGLSTQGRRLLRMLSLNRIFEVFEVESAAVEGYQREAA